VTIAYVCTHRRLADLVYSLFVSPPLRLLPDHDLPESPFVDPGDARLLWNQP
jgi:hypothetical protein